MQLLLLSIDRRADAMSILAHRCVCKEYGLPLERNVELSIDLILGAALISTTPYRMSLT